MMNAIKNMRQTCVLLWNKTRAKTQVKFASILSFKKKHVSVPLTLISLSAFACCSWWRAKALGLVFTTTAFVLFLQAPFFVPHLQLSQQPKSAFLHGQPCDFEVFFLLQVFLQEQVCNKSNNHIPLFK